MQTLNSTTAAPAIATGATVTPATTPKPVSTAKPAKAIAKPAPKPATPAAKPADTDRAIERAVAGAAVAAYYTGGSSLPFKAASDTFRPLAVNTKAATQRQAALFAAMLVADRADNIKPDGTFVRGGFRLPARLFNPKAPADALVSCQPESGCLSDANGRAVSYVSGPTTGKAQRETVLRLDLGRVRAEISQHLGDKLGKLAIARIDALTGGKHRPAPAKPAKAA